MALRAGIGTFMRTRVGGSRTGGSASRREGGFTFVELIAGLTLFLGLSLLLLQTFMNSMTYANRSDARGAATTIAMQVMEQIRSSSNPYTMVGFTNITRTALPLSSPYNGVVNPSSHTFQVSVTVTPDNNLNLSTVTVNVYQPTDANNAPTATLTTVLDAQ